MKNRTKMNCLGKKKIWTCDSISCTHDWTNKIAIANPFRGCVGACVCSCTCQNDKTVESDSFSFCANRSSLNHQAVKDIQLSKILYNRCYHKAPLQYKHHWIKRDIFRNSVRYICMEFS